MALAKINNHFEITFKDLQSVCNSVLLDPTQQNLDRLNFTCNSLHPDDLQHFFKYILVPLAIHLSKKQDDLSCRVLNSLSHLLSNFTFSVLAEFFDVYLLLLGQLQGIHRDNDNERNMSEEVKLNIVKCISILMKNSKQNIREEFLQRKYYSKLSPGIFLCTKLATTEKYISLKVEALNCLMNLTLVSDDCKASDCFRPKLAEVLMLMIPGITGTCIKIINSSDTLNHRPIVLVLKLWSRILAITLSKTPNEEKLTIFSLKQQINKMSDMKPSSSDEDFNSFMKDMALDEGWIQKTDRCLAPIMQSILNCQNSGHWKVRLAIATASNLLLTTCGNNLSQSVGHLIETLVFLSQDENPSVANYCKASIERLSHQCKILNNRGLVGIVEENLYSLLTKFPRVLHGKDITIKERQLVLVSGFLDILGEKHLPAVLSSLQHLNRFFYCLMMCATPDCSRTTLIEDVAIRGLDSTVHSMEHKWRHLKFCETSRCEDILKNICSKLVKYSDLGMLLNNFLDEFNSNEGNRKSIALLFILFFSSGGELEYFKSHPSLLKDLIDALMDQTLWDIPTSINEEVTAKNAIQENIVKICLLAEAVGSLSVAAGPTLFLPYLLQCLYPILECAGNPLSMISAAGLISLHKLAGLYEDSSIPTLIAKNVDYLSHHVTHKLRKAHRNPRVLSVLTVIMEYSSFKTLPSIHSIINDVLIQSCDLFQDINGSAFLHVFNTYLTCIKKWMVIKDVPTDNGGKKDMSIALELLEYKKNLEAAEGKYEEPNDSFMDPSQFSISDEEPTVINGEKEKEQLPDHIVLTRDILSRSLHFLPANIITRQILVLQILDQGIKILSEWEDELLPSVHKIWSPLVNRFKNSTNPLLLQRAFSLLLTLATYSREFIRTRTVKEVLPALCKVLTDSIKESIKADRMGIYFVTQTYKLQLMLLSNLGNLSRDLELTYYQVYPILTTTTPYLSRRQPTSLQAACIELYTCIGKRYGDLVWSHLMTVCPDRQEFKAPLEGLRDYKLDDSSYDRREYSDAVDKLLHIL